jgi:hypothetical protein
MMHQLVAVACALLLDMMVLALMVTRRDPASPNRTAAPDSTSSCCQPRRCRGLAVPRGAPRSTGSSAGKLHTCQSWAATVVVLPPVFSLRRVR